MKIPKKAKRVFSGVIYDVYQWPERNFDGSEATFEAVKRHDSVQIIPTDGTHVYIAREEQPGRKPFYSFFGGRVEAGESALSAAKRELREESALVSTDWKLLERYSAPGRIDWTIYYYIARNCQFVGQQALDAGERIQVLRIPFKKFLRLVQHPEFRGTDRVLQMLRGGLDPKKVSTFQKSLF